MQIRLGLTAAATGTADAITATFSPAPTALVDRMVLFVTASAANATTTPTFSPNGLTAHTITKFGGNALQSGDILGAGHVLLLQYNLASTRWELLNPGKLLTHSTLAQVLDSDNKTNGVPFASNNGLASLMLDNSYMNATYGANYSGWYFDNAEGTIYWSNGTVDGQLHFTSARVELHHDTAINFNAPTVTVAGFAIATQNFVDQRLQSNIKIIGDWDATSGSMPLDDESNTTPFIAQWGSTIKQGWAFRVGYGQAGTVGGYDYEEGDVVYALMDNAGSTPADWGDMDHNLQQATESLRGTAKIVTIAIMEDETTLDDEKIVTPYKFWAKAIPRFKLLAHTWDLLQSFTNGIRSSIYDSSTGEFKFTKTVAGTILFWTNGQHFRFSATTGGAPSMEIDKTTGKIKLLDETASTPVKLDSNKGLTSGEFGDGAGEFCEGNDSRLAVYEIKNHKALAVTLAANTTYYLGGLVIAWNVTQNQRRFNFEDIGTIEKVSFNFSINNVPSNEQATLYLRNNTTGTDYSLGNIDFSLCGANTALMLKFTGLSIPVGNTTDQWTWKLVTAATMTTAPSSFYCDAKIYNRIA